MRNGIRSSVGELENDCNEHKEKGLLREHLETETRDRQRKKMKRDAKDLVLT